MCGYIIFADFFFKMLFFLIFNIYEYIGTGAGNISGSVLCMSLMRFNWGCFDMTGLELFFFRD
jgi:hypothetical protein